MAVKLRTVNNQDVKLISSGPVTSTAPKGFTSGLYRTVADPALFGTKPEHSAKNSKNFEYEDEYCRTASISLNIPVLNPFLAGPKGDMWKTILNRSLQDAKKYDDIHPEYCWGNKVKDLAHGNTVLDTKTGKVIAANKINGLYMDCCERYLIGGNALLWIVNQVNWTKEIQNELYDSFVYPLLEKSQKELWLEKCQPYGEIRFSSADTINPETIDGYLFDRFYFDCQDKILQQQVKDLAEETIFSKLENVNSRLALLLAVRRNLSNFTGQVMKEMFVLPLGYRPIIDGRVDLLTRFYDTIVKENNRLHELRSKGNSSFRSVINAYKSLVAYVTITLIGKDITVSRNLVQQNQYFKSVMERLKDKEGLVRGRMQGVRMDYSGRTVITCDPYMSLDTIGLPIKVLGKLTEVKLVKDIRTFESVENPDLENANLIYWAGDNKIQNLNDKAVEMFEKELNNPNGKKTYVIIGRQPTLFNLGMQAFKVKPVKGNAIVLSPLVVMPFNADFDGDQMHFKFPVTEEAQEEARVLMGSTNNLFYPRSGDLTVEMRHEILYGLWVACNQYKFPEGKKSRVWTASDLDALREEMKLMYQRHMAEGDDLNNITGSTYGPLIYEAVCKQKIAVYDLIDPSVAQEYQQGNSVLTAGETMLGYKVKNYWEPADEEYNKQVSQKAKSFKKAREAAFVKEHMGEEFNDVQLEPKGKIIYNYMTAGQFAVKFAMGVANAKFALGSTDIYGSKKLKTFSYEDESGNIILAKDVEMAVRNEEGTNKWFKKVLTKTTERWVEECQPNSDEENARKDEFVRIVNRMVKLGFKISTIWVPGISVINELDVKTSIEEFNQRVARRAELVDLGIELESAYSKFFKEEYDRLIKGFKDTTVVDSNGCYISHDGIMDIVKSQIKSDSGYMRMINSGAKGNKSNLQQIFGTKGQIMKNDNEAFNSIITNSLSESLTALESFVSAYGSRQGLADKVLATAEPGYLTRKLEHAAACMSITAHDCGTNEGLTIGYNDILPFLDPTRITGNPDTDAAAVEEFIIPLLLGRTILPENKRIVSKKDAKEAFYRYVVNDDVDEAGIHHITPLEGGVIMRSPITCHHPCCQVCYGKDLTTNRKYPKIGKPVGFVAAQAIGEPGTQLTMKNFQRGGVASDANLTSAFDKIDQYFTLGEKIKSVASKHTLAYDALSPVEGYIRPLYKGDGTKIIRVMATSDPSDNKNILKSEKYVVNENLKLKSYVKRGESFQEIQGDLDIKEIIRYHNIKDAMRYLVLQLYNTFNAETSVNLKHFEVIVANMHSFVVINGDENIYSGEILSNIEYYEWINTYNPSGVVVRENLYGVKALPKIRKDFFEAMIMEDMGTNVRRSILVSPVDTMKNPKTRLSFGQYIGVGSDVSGFME